MKQIENRVPLSICYLPSADFCYFAVSAIPLAFRRQQQPAHGATRPKFSQGHRCIFADKLRRTKDRDAIREVSFRRGLRPTATALKQLQREGAQGWEEWREREKVARTAFASSSAVQGCINLTLSLHSVTPFLSPFLLVPGFSWTLNSPLILSAVV